jgi:hypothetical protein
VGPAACLVAWSPHGLNPATRVADILLASNVVNHLLNTLHTLAKTLQGPVTQTCVLLHRSLQAGPCTRHLSVFWRPFHAKRALILYSVAPGPAPAPADR